MQRLARGINTSICKLSLNKFQSSRVCLFHSGYSSFLENAAPMMEEDKFEKKEISLVSIPFIGEGISNVKLVKWNKQVGDQVDYGDSVAEMEQYDQNDDNPLSIIVNSQRRGIVEEQLIVEGDVVQVGEVILKLQVDKMNDEELANDITKSMTKTEFSETSEVKTKMSWKEIGIIGFFVSLSFYEQILNFITLGTMLWE